MIFIAHSSLDTGFAKTLARDMKQSGVDVWIDVIDIAPNTDWNASIQEALARSHYLLVIWSKSSVISPEVLAEVFQSKSENRQIIQVFKEDCKRPAQFDRLQSIDFQQAYDEAFENLLSFLGKRGKRQRLEELQQVMPYNPYPSVPELAG